MNIAARRHTLADLLHRSARRHPDKLALLCGQVSWSYAQIDAIVDRLAAGLAERGIALGYRVALLSHNSHAFVALRFALARLGAVLVPINFMLNAQEVGYILRHSGARLLATDTQLADLARAAAHLQTQVEDFLWLPGEYPSLAPEGMARFDHLSASTANVPQPSLAVTELAQIIYTSGTESTPKGAMLTHDALISQYVSCLIDAQISSQDVVLHAMPLYHCAQLDVFLGPCMYVGATSVITSGASAENILALLSRHAITSFFAPPTVWISLLRSPMLEKTDLSALCKGYYGASIMPVQVLRELAERLPRLQLFNLYGQTEIAPLATILVPQDQLRKAGSAGRAALNVETRVVDDLGQDVPPGVVGEIVHRSPHLMLGYYNDPQRTAAAFEGGWFHTGDLGVIDQEGYLTVVDRKKDMIKTGGENVASREVEETIYHLSGVSEVAVVSAPHPHWIEGVVAVVVPKAGIELSQEQVLSHCRAHLAQFKIPKRVIIADALPKNPSGKLLKRQLRLDHQNVFQE